MVQVGWEPLLYSPLWYQTTWCVVCQHVDSQEFDMICIHFWGVSNHFHKIQVWLRPLHLNRCRILHKSHLCYNEHQQILSKGQGCTKRANPICLIILYFPPIIQSNLRLAILQDKEKQNGWKWMYEWCGWKRSLLPRLGTPLPYVCYHHIDNTNMVCVM